MVFGGFQRQLEAREDLTIQAQKMGRVPRISGIIGGGIQAAEDASMKKILIVEDQDEIRELIRVTLEFDDYEIDEAPNGAIGLSKAASFKPDLILLDVMMPGGLNGLQVCEKVKADPVLRGSKVILLTARGQESDRQAGLKAGADEYLIKPFSPMDLMRVIDTVLA